MTAADHGAEIKAAIATASTYAASGGLVIGDYMQYLNNNAGAFGVGLGVATYFTNLHFKIKNSRALLKAQIEHINQQD